MKYNEIQMMKKDINQDSIVILNKIQVEKNDMNKERSL